MQQFRLIFIGTVPGTLSAWHLIRSRTTTARSLSLRYCTSSSIVRSLSVRVELEGECSDLLCIKCPFLDKATHAF